MNNINVEKMLVDCYDELLQITSLLAGFGNTSPVALYLTKYALIRACGAIEQSFKALIADRCAHRSKAQVKRFLDRKIRESSVNPSYSNICCMLAEFDKVWQTDFKNGLKTNQNFLQIKTSLNSLVGARNDFAHGGSPSTSIGDVIIYFAHSRIVIEQIDVVVSN